MSSVLYYSNNCEPSKKLLQTISKTQGSTDMHFMCIDRRTKSPDGKTFIILQNGQKVLMPPNITQVPALMLLNQNYKVIYGNDIYNYLKPQQEVQVKKATQNNMEPISYDTFGGFGGSITSDNYSFLDMNDNDLSVKGDGGMRQMHHYVSLQESTNAPMHLPSDDTEYKTGKLKDGETSIEALQRQREADMKNYGSGPGRPNAR